MRDRRVQRERMSADIGDAGEWRGGACWRWRISSRRLRPKPCGGRGVGPPAAMVAQFGLRARGGGADSAVDGALSCQTVLKAAAGRYFEAARLLQDQFSADNGNAGEWRGILALTFGFHFLPPGSSQIHVQVQVQVHLHLDRLVGPVVPGNGCGRLRCRTRAHLVRTGIAEGGRRCLLHGLL